METAVQVRSVADEAAYLNQWFGLGGYRVLGRQLFRGSAGTVYDRLDVQLADGRRGDIWFNVADMSTYPAGQAAPPVPIPEQPTSRFSGALVPALVLAGLFGLAWLSRPEEKHREILRRMRDRK